MCESIKKFVLNSSLSSLNYASLALTEWKEQKIYKYSMSHNWISMEFAFNIQSALRYNIFKNGNFTFKM